MLKESLTVALLLLGPIIMVGIMTVLSLLAYRFIFKRSSSKKQVVFVTVAISIILVAPGVWSYFQSPDMRVPGWFVVAYYVFTIAIGCFVAKMSEKRKSKRLNR